MLLCMGAPGLAHLLARPVLIGVIAEAARIELRGVEAVTAFDDALGEVIADRAAPEDAAGHALGDPDIVEPPGRPHQRQLVGGHLEGTADIGLDADAAERRHEVHRPLPVPRDGIEILFEQIGAEPLRHAVFGKQLQMLGLLIGAEHQAVALLAQITLETLVAQDRHFRQALALALDHLRNGIGDPVLMDDRDRRDVEAEHGAGLARIVAGR
ncbi:hypothetical protein D3C87_1585380 [compost metagenome]